MITNVNEDFYTSLPEIMILRQTSLLSRVEDYRQAGLINCALKTYATLYAGYMMLKVAQRAYPVRLTYYHGVFYQPRQTVLRSLPCTSLYSELRPKI